jgi:thymidylate synthase
MKIVRAEKQYLDAMRHIHANGVDLKNARTGEICRTVINVDLTYDATTNKAPLVTTRRIPNPGLSIAELLGYIKGVTSAAQMRELGTKTWDSNANENKAWLANPNRKGEDDLGMIYGAVAKNWPLHERSRIEETDVIKAQNRQYDGVAKNWPVQNQCDPLGSDVVGKIDLFHKVYNNLKNGIDDRGEIITFWNPGTFQLGCLRPCMYEHQFSLLGDDLYLNSTQRSADFPLGTTANMVQVWLLLRLMAQITNKNPKHAFHRNVNSHIYGSQLDLVPTQLELELLEEPTIDINPDIKTLEDLETWVGINDFKITYPEAHPSIKYPFAV